MLHQREYAVITVKKTEPVAQRIIKKHVHQLMTRPVKECVFTENALQKRVFVRPTERCPSENSVAPQDKAISTVFVQSCNFYNCDKIMKSLYLC